MGKHQIMSVPKETRVTSDWDMFATWVGANANNGTWFIGWTAVNTFITATSVSYLLHDLLSWPVYGKPADCILLNKSDFHHVLMDHSEVLYNIRHGKISLKFTDKQ